MRTSGECFRSLQAAYEALNGESFRSVAVWPGLVKIHASPRALQSRLPVPAGMRRPITGFSRASRWNLIQRLCSCKQFFENRPVVFGTLTLAGEKISFQTLRVFFKAFCARVRMQVQRGKVPPEWGTFFWRFEFGAKNGRAHAHLVFPLADRVSWEWLASVWGAGFVWVERVKPRNVSAYLAKYVSKDAGNSGLLPESGAGSLDYHVKSEQLGRFWGIVGRRLLDFRYQVLVYVRDMWGEIDDIRAGFARFLKKFSRGYVRNWDFRGSFLLDSRVMEKFLEEIGIFTCGFCT